MCSFFMSNTGQCGHLTVSRQSLSRSGKRFDGSACHTWLQSFGLPAAESSTAQATLTQDLQQVAQMFSGVW
jgi:hypothetical protein